MTAGIIAVAAIAVLTIVTLVFARVGGLRGEKVTLYVVTDAATGVLPGTEVWLSGQQAGLVKDVSFRSPSTAILERVIIRTHFLESALPSVRRDSYAQIRPSGSLIGKRIVFIASGSASSPPLHDGDTVYTRQKAKVGDLEGDVATVGPALTQLLAGLSQLDTMIKNPVGTIGNARARGLARMPEIRGRVSSIRSKASRGEGTIGLASRTHLMERASRAMAATDSIRSLMSSKKGTLGRFRSDSTLVTKASGVLAELDTLQLLLSNPVASISAAHPDSALTKEMARTRGLLASLIKDIKTHPSRYISF
ncbi:MAG TPA: MlaD family protein [Gemmatimonadaceae bacterium]|nr:MlaD family protein [Gemmatimonadaceae bacterium]